MTAQPMSGTDHPFLDTLAESHRAAEEALDAKTPLDAIVWLSAHLAACQRSLHRKAEHVRTATGPLHALRAADLELERVLRRAEQHHAGDSLAAQLDEARLENVLRGVLDRHERAERELVAELVQRLDADGVEDLTASYDDALRHAPTRPHPHVPHRGVLGAVAFRVDALRDKVLDTMDGRHVPAPRQERRTVRPGRWGSYVLGKMND